MIMHFFIYFHKKLQINLFANFGFFKTANKFICKDNIFATIYSSFKEYQRLNKYIGKYNTLESQYNSTLKISLYQNYHYIKNLLHWRLKIGHP